MNSRSINVSEAHARVLERAKQSRIEEYDGKDDDEYEYILICPKQYSTTQFVSADSQLKIKKNDFNKMHFNLKSTIFDNDFNMKNIRKISMIKNRDNSVDFIINFHPVESQIKKVNGFPKNPVYNNVNNTHTRIP